MGPNGLGTNKEERKPKKRFDNENDETKLMNGFQSDLLNL
jgi:hypothetical protein